MCYPERCTKCCMCAVRAVVCPRLVCKFTKTFYAAGQIGALKHTQWVSWFTFAITRVRLVYCEIYAKDSCLSCPNGRAGRTPSLRLWLSIHRKNGVKCGWEISRRCSGGSEGAWNRSGLHMLQVGIYRCVVGVS